jgi:hypothetical protein
MLASIQLLPSRMRAAIMTLRLASRGFIVTFQIAKQPLSYRGGFRLGPLPAGFPCVRFGRKSRLFGWPLLTAFNCVPPILATMNWQRR